MRPFFSIIVPVYNLASYLRECLDSIRSQSFSNFEVICIDDGSTDASPSILDEYARLDARFRVSHQPNGGVSRARNFGLSVAKGDWICFVDGDDLLSAMWLEVSNRLIEMSGADCIRMGLTAFEDGRPLPAIKPSNEYRIIRGRRDLDRWGWYELRVRGHAVRVFLKSSIACSQKFPEGVAFAEDSLWCLALLNKLSSICQGAFAGYFYRQRSNSACNQVYHALERVEFLRNLQKIGPADKQMRAFGADAWSCVSNWILRNKDDRSASISIREALRELQQHTGLRPSAIKFANRLQYMAFLYCGMKWPTIIGDWMYSFILFVYHNTGISSLKKVFLGRYAAQKKKDHASA